MGERNRQAGEDGGRELAGVVDGEHLAHRVIPTVIAIMSVLATDRNDQTSAFLGCGLISLQARCG